MFVFVATCNPRQAPLSRHFGFNRFASLRLCSAGAFKSCLGPKKLVVNSRLVDAQFSEAGQDASAINGLGPQKKKSASAYGVLSL